MQTFWKYFDRLIEIMAAIAGIILIFITCAVCYTIGMRFLFTKTTIWIIPITEYSLLWIVFLATSWLLRENGHITTDIIFSHLNEKAKKTLNFIMFNAGGLTCAILFILGVLYMYECISKKVTDVRAITVPKAYVFVIIPVGSILLAIQFFRMAWERSQSNKKR